MIIKKLVVSSVMAVALVAMIACQGSPAAVSPISTPAPTVQATQAVPGAAPSPQVGTGNDDAQAKPVIVQDTSGGISIVLNGDSIATQGPGVTVEGSTATITEGGAYALSGTLADGQIVVDAGEDAVVTLVLDGVNIRNSTNAPLYLVNAAQVVITLADGSTNSIADAASYVYADAETDEPDAAVFANVDVVFAGNGSLSVEGNYKDGISSKKGLAINSGTYAIDAAGDGINADGDILINDGVIVMAVGDDGIHTEANMTINGGDIRINRSVEGLEAMVMTLNGGEIRIVSSDDGVNIAGDVEEGTGRPGRVVTEYNGVYWLYINDVYLVVDSSGDGIDSNGAIVMSGGTVIVNGPTVNREGAIDYDGTFNISGGLIVAAGSAGMPMTASPTTTQNAILINFDALQQAGTRVHISDSKGNAVLTFDPTKDYQSLAFSSPELLTGETYTIYLGGEATGTVNDSLWQDETYTPGTEYASFTISGPVTTIGMGRMWR